MQPTGCIVLFAVAAVCIVNKKDQKTDYVTTGGDVFHIMYKPSEEEHGVYEIRFETVEHHVIFRIALLAEDIYVDCVDENMHIKRSTVCDISPGHMCSTHIRFTYNTYQIFDNGKYLWDCKGKPRRKYTYGPIARVQCYTLFSESPEPRFPSLFPGSEHFFTSRFKIRYGKSSAMLSVGKVLLFEGFTGNGSFYYWNDKGYRANEPAILKLTDDSGSLINLELTIHWERKVVDVSEPNQFVCNSFPYTLNVNAPSLVFVVIKVFANEFEIKVNGRECAVKHRYDPNDIKLLIVEGNIEPFRYAIYEHDEEYLYDIYDIITTY